MLVLGITLILLFAFFEVALRIFYPQPVFSRAEEVSPKIFEESDYTPWKLKPYSSDRIISGTGNEFNVPVTINSYGLRDDEIYENELKEKTIIGAIGDSFTYGTGIRLEEAYHQKLEKMLNRKSEHFRVINMGRADGALTTDVQYLYLKRKGLKFNPKIIIVGYCVGNDITDIGRKTTWLDVDAQGNPTNITTTLYYVDEEGRYRRIFERYEEGNDIFYKINRFISTWSHAGFFIKKLIISAFLVKPFPDYVKVHPEDYLAKFDISKKMLVEINKMLEDNNSTLVVMMIPSKVQMKDKAWEDYKKHFGENAYRYNPQEEVMSFCVQNNIHCLDLLPNFIGRHELYFKIDGHWNGEGNELAANKLYEYLVTEGLV